ncbi:MAG: DUF58 domain-containing protein [Treponema sp.]|nr:DUF58 domain-containing protein [Treponema sp.]
MLHKPTETRPTLRRAMFAPRAMGILVLVVIVLAFLAGILGREIGLVLAGAVFLTIWAYCLLMTLLIALINARRARRARIQVSPGKVEIGTLAEAFYSEGENSTPLTRIFQLPGILVRCRLLLATKDERRIWHDFNPARPGPHPFEVKKRGAYFSEYDEFAVFDILGFFRFAFRLPSEAGEVQASARLLAKPRPSGEPPPVNARAGDSNLKPEFSLQRSDILIDHRPYVPGDDPRRINWKLYGHGGSLIVREGEREPPPHANLTILIDTEYDPSLYDKSQARRGIDLLCENALGAAIACTESGMHVLVGYLDGVIRGGAGDSNPLSQEFATALAWPAARPWVASPDTGSPKADDSTATLPIERGILILALPRSCTETALDRLLRKATHRQGFGKIRPVDLLFLCQGKGGAPDSIQIESSASLKVAPNWSRGAMETPAETLSPIESERLAAAQLCVSLFNQRPGVKARLIMVQH